MASNRIGRINEEIQRELAELLRELKDPRVHKTMVSITHVETTPDLRYAKVYVSLLDRSCAKEVLAGLKSSGGFLRRALGKDGIVAAVLRVGAVVVVRQVHPLQQRDDLALERQTRVIRSKSSHVRFLPILFGRLIFV